MKLCDSTGEKHRVASPSVPKKYLQSREPRARMDIRGRSQAALIRKLLQSRVWAPGGPEVVLVLSVREFRNFLFQFTSKQSNIGILPSDLGPMRPAPSFPPSLRYPHCSCISATQRPPDLGPTQLSSAPSPWRLPPPPSHSRGPGCTAYPRLSPLPAPCTAGQSSESVRDLSTWTLCQHGRPCTLMTLKTNWLLWLLSNRSQIPPSVRYSILTENISNHPPLSSPSDHTSCCLPESKITGASSPSPCPPVEQVREDPLSLGAPGAGVWFCDSNHSVQNLFGRH